MINKINDDLYFSAFLSVYSVGYIMLVVHAMGGRQGEEKEDKSV